MTKNSRPPWHDGKIAIPATRTGPDRTLPHPTGDNRRTAEPPANRHAGRQTAATPRSHKPNRSANSGTPRPARSCAGAAKACSDKAGPRQSRARPTRKCDAAGNSSRRNLWRGGLRHSVRGRFRRRRSGLLQSDLMDRCGETPTTGLEVELQDGSPRRQDDITIRGQKLLLLAENFAEESLGPGPVHGLADPFRSNHSETSDRRTRGVVPDFQVQQKSAAVPTLSLGAHNLKFGRAADMLRSTKTHREAPLARARRLHAGAQTLAALGPTGGKHLATAVRRIAGAEAELAGAFELGGTVGRLHGSKVV